MVILTILKWYLIIGCIIAIISLPKVIMETIQLHKERSKKDPIYSLKSNLWQLTKFILGAIFIWPLLLLVIVSLIIEGPHIWIG